LVDRPSTRIATEWDITQIHGWGGGPLEPLQFVFGTDGAISVGDEGGYVDRITIAGGAPTAVTQVNDATGCGNSGPIDGRGDVVTQRRHRRDLPVHDGHVAGRHLVRDEPVREPGDQRLAHLELQRRRT
jgi:hypothetical protein